MLQIAGAAAGLLILGGLWTPVAGVLAGIVEVWIGLGQPGIQSSALILATLGISLAMIGPGAWSIDARCMEKAASSAGVLIAAQSARYWSTSALGVAIPEFDISAFDSDGHGMGAVIGPQTSPGCA